MKQQLETYTHSKTPLLPQLGEMLSKIRKTDLTEHMMLLLLSRICFMGYLASPFGIAYFAALFFRKPKLSLALVALAGICSVNYLTFALKYGGAFFILAVVAILFRTELGTKRRLRGLITASALCISGAVYVVTEGFFAYDVILLVAECGMAFLAYFIFDKATEAIRTAEKRTVFEHTETVSMMILGGTVVLSISLINSFLPVGHILAILAILVLSVSCGFEVSCAAGAVFGLGIGLADSYSAQTVCIYTISAFAAGMMKRYGKIGVSAAFAFISFAVTVLLCPESGGIVTVSYVALAATLLFLIPDRVLAGFGTLTASFREEEAIGERIRDTVKHELDKTVTSIDAVSSVFQDVLTDMFETNEEPHGVIFDNTADSVCKKCTLCKYCWNKNREETLSCMTKMFHVLEHHNTISKNDIPQEFTDMCIRRDAFINELNKHYEAFKINRMWAGRVAESKRLVAEQFGNISMILKTMKDSLSRKMCFEPELEQKIVASLDRRGISAGKVTVCGGDGFSVSMDKVSCGESRVCSTTVAAALSEVLEVPMLRENRVCSDSICHLTFSQQTRFVTDIATASVTRKHSRGSGDNVSYFPCGDGKIALILSDGMGSGEKAHFLSSVTIRVAKNLLSAGFDKETCVRLINNILMTDTDRDTFATIDLALLNLYTGTMEFVKTGATNSYVKTDSGFETVYASSLPAGLMPSLEPDYDLRYMKAGDYLIIASDGITDILDAPDRNEILEIAEGYEGNAQTLADQILNAALSYSDGVAYDDMTVMVCSISEHM